MTRIVFEDNEAWEAHLAETVERCAQAVEGLKEDGQALWNAALACAAADVRALSTPNSEPKRVVELTPPSSFIEQRKGTDVAEFVAIAGLNGRELTVSRATDGSGEVLLTIWERGQAATLQAVELDAATAHRAASVLVPKPDGEGRA